MLSGLLGETKEAEIDRGTSKGHTLVGHVVHSKSGDACPFLSGILIDPAKILMQIRKSVPGIDVEFIKTDEKHEST